MLHGARYPVGESNILEFKANFNKCAIPTYEKCINAFLNSNGGQLVFGVNDKNIIHGIAYKKGVSEDSIRLTFDDIFSRMRPQPLATLNVDSVKITSCLNVITINVIRQHCLHPLYFVGLRGGAWKRMSASCHRINSERIYSLEEYTTIEVELDAWKKYTKQLEFDVIEAKSNMEQAVQIRDAHISALVKVCNSEEPTPEKMPNYNITLNPAFWVCELLA